MRWSRRILGCLVLGTSVFILGSCGGNQQIVHGAAPGQQGMPAPAVTVATAAQEAVPINVDAIGNAQPYRTVQLKSMVDRQISRSHCREVLLLR